MHKLLIGFVLFLLAAGNLAGQNKYWIFFTDKQSSDRSNYVSSETLLHRSMLGLELHQHTDIPVTKAYVDAIKDLHVQVRTTSKWLNAVAAYLTEDQVRHVADMDFVLAVQPIYGTIYPTWNKPLSNLDDQWYFAYRQVNGEGLNAKGLTGKSVKIGIIDGGFLNANRMTSLTHIFSRKHVRAIRDFVQPDNDDLFNNTKGQFNEHGAYVWQMIAGRGINNRGIGCAPDASFYLARTDDGNREYRGEEDLWVAALEWMDSLGVRLINTSLGYSTGFDNIRDNYSPHDMDGKTAIISRAAEIAVREKGMIIVTSAGNEGGNSWGVVSAPADAQDVIAVGATDFYARKLPVSSTGSEQVSFIKPDVACYSAGGGTSISAPVITGLIACILQEKPEVSSSDMAKLIREASHLHQFPNNFLGYGVPDGAKLLNITNTPFLIQNRSEILRAEGSSVMIDVNDIALNPITAFHKKDMYHVLGQEIIRPVLGKVVVTQEYNCERTTLVTSKKVVEIVWPKL